MDILAHGLWAGAAAVALAPGYRPKRSVWMGFVGLSVVPDLGHMLPVTGWAIAELSSADWWQYAVASPGQEPPMPETVRLWAHHLHCVLHSALPASLVTALVWCLRGALWWPLLGWWLHIVIDVFTHSAAFFPSPVLYPLTSWGFDGVPWNHPAFMLANYAALALTWACLHRLYRRHRGP
jgi:hypothetical protein